MDKYDLKVKFFFGSEITLTSSWSGQNKESLAYCDKVYFIRDGECEINIGNTIYHAAKGDAFFIKRGIMHSYNLTQSGYLNKYWYHFTIDYNGNPLFDELSLPYFHHFYDFEEADRIFGSIDATQKDISPLGHIHLTNSILNMVEYYYNNTSRISSSEKKTDLSNIVKYMFDNLDKNITTKELAAMVHLQENYFIKKFKKEYSMSPKQLINRRKYDIIEGLLVNTNTPIIDIMISTGFSDYGYFSNFFKRYSGYSPREYRKICKQLHSSLKTD